MDEWQLVMYRSSGPQQAAAAAAAAAAAPPTSSPLTSVWYWMLDGRPMTVVYHKPNKEVSCNGYLLDTYVI